MLRLTRLVEQTFCFFAINVFLTAYFALPLKLEGASLGAGDQNVYYTTAQAVVLFGTITLCSLNLRSVLTVAAASTLMNCFILWAAFSVAWSVAPFVSMRRVVTLAAASGFAYYLVATKPMASIIGTIAMACVIAAIASAVTVLIMPEIGLMGRNEVESPDLVGAWNGVFTHKNQLGVNMVLGAQSCAWIAMTQPKRRWLASAGGLICVAIAFQARSATAEIGVLAIPVLVLGLRALRLPGLLFLWAGFAVMAFCLLVTGVAYLFFSDLTQMIGKDASLTGRLPLWSELIPLAGSRIVQGYGYMAFFVAGNPDMDMVQRAIGWDAPEAHQAYLDLALELGAPGVVLAVALLARTIWLALAALRAGTPSWASLAAVVSLTLAATSMVESVLLRAGNIYVMLLALFYAALRAPAAQDAVPWGEVVSIGRMPGATQVVRLPNAMQTRSARFTSRPEADTHV